MDALSRHPGEVTQFAKKQSTPEKQRRDSESFKCSASIAFDFKLHLCLCHLIVQSFNNVVSHYSFNKYLFFFLVGGKASWHFILILPRGGIDGSKDQL